MMDELSQNVRGGLVELIFAIYENEPVLLCKAAERIGVLRPGLDRIAIERLARFALAEFEAASADPLPLSDTDTASTTSTSTSTTSTTSSSTSSGDDTAKKESIAVVGGGAEIAVQSRSNPQESIKVRQNKATLSGFIKRLESECAAIVK
jgi:hypothetical protein